MRKLPLDVFCPMKYKKQNKKPVYTSALFPDRLFAIKYGANIFK